MKNLKNNVQLLGNLGNDPEVKKLESGKVVAKLSLATHDSYKNAEGELVKHTQWHRLTAWGMLAEQMEKALKKGSTVLVQGSLNHRSYEDKEGNTRYVSEVVVRDFKRFPRVNQGMPV